MGYRLNSSGYFIIVFFYILLSGCTDNEPVIPTPNPPDPDPPEFSVPAAEDMIIYEVNIRAFGPGTDFNAVIDRLDEIKKLNVNVLWLMPIHPIGEINSVNSPYSVQNYFGINPEFGTSADLKMLIEEAHERNIAVIIDWVANHTAWDNPWIENKEWYTQDEAGNITHPPGTNWLDVADLNYENQEMRMAMIEAMNHWITDVGIDGFRCDAADMVPFDFWEQAISELNSIPDRSLVLLAEGARKDHFTAGFQMNYSWGFYAYLKNVFDGDLPPNMLYVTHVSNYSGISDEKRWLRFTTNHDESAWDATPVVLFNGIEGALAASVVSTYMGGVPLIYGTQEVGTQGPVPFFSTSNTNWAQNPEMLTAYHKIYDHYNSSKASKTTEIHPMVHPKVVSFMKFAEDESLLVLVNTSQQQLVYSVEDSLANSNWTNAMDNSQFQLGSEVEFKGYEYLVLNRIAK